MLVSFDFDCDAWIRGVEIDAKSFEEAEDKLRSLSLTELIEVGYVKDFELKDIDYEILEDTVTVHAFDIEYDEENTENLPTELDVTVTYNPNEDDLDYAVSDEIYYKTDALVKSCSYTIINN